MRIIRLWDTYNNRISFFLLLLLAHFGDAWLTHAPVEMIKKAGAPPETLEFFWMFVAVAKMFLFFFLCFALRVHSVSIPKSMKEARELEDAAAR